MWDVLAVTLSFALLALTLFLFKKASYCAWLASHPGYDDATWADRAILYLVGALSALAIAVVPLIRLALRSARRRRRRDHGLCENCAYDLRMLASPRCPECGATIEAKPGKEDANGPL